MNTINVAFHAWREPAVPIKATVHKSFSFDARYIVLTIGDVSLFVTPVQAQTLGDVCANAVREAETA